MPEMGGLNKEGYGDILPPPLIKFFSIISLPFNNSKLRYWSLWPRLSPMESGWIWELLRRGRGRFLWEFCQPLDKRPTLPSLFCADKILTAPMSEAELALLSGSVFYNYLLGGRVGGRMEFKAAKRQGPHSLRRYSV